MKFRILISLFACVAVPAAAHAETVSRKEANSIAGTFFNAAYGEVTAPPQMVWNGRQLTTDRLFSPIYVELDRTLLGCFVLFWGGVAAGVA